MSLGGTFNTQTIIMLIPVSILTVDAAALLKVRLGLEMCLSSKHEALSSGPGITKKKKSYSFLFIMCVCVYTKAQTQDLAHVRQALYLELYPSPSFIESYQLSGPRVMVPPSCHVSL
jgi:hypothetical protein